MVSSLWPPAMVGGAERHAAQLAYELRQRGHEVAAMTLGATGEGVIRTVPAWPFRLDEYEGKSALRRALFHLRDVYDPVAATTTRRALREYAPDVVHTHSVAGLSVAVMTAPSAARVAHVHHLHDYWLLCQRTSFVQRDGTVCEHRCAPCHTISALRETLLRRHGPDRLIAPSFAMARAHGCLEWTTGRIEVAHLPAPDLEPKRPEWPEWPERPAERPVTFGYLGRLTVEKGVRALLAAFRSIADLGCRLLVGGRGALAAEVRGPGVEALGWLDGDDRDSFWRDVDCLVVPSLWAEPGAMVAIEARAEGLPVIAADAGCLSEVVEDASRPLLFPPGDVDGLARSLRSFAAEPERFRPSPTDSWTGWDDYIATVLRVYSDAIANART